MRRLLRGIGWFFQEAFLAFGGIVLFLVLFGLMVGVALAAVGFIWWFVKGWFGQ